ncbi:sulfotransferase domain-containing protein [Panacibacter ginsenosidivorans]|uniref:Sulfotransferase domain-containing protein n=1 Tax=Panacibacter ginsenosidivorans TaxID=1813871 RepID=A0A5B8VC31_9BACT|nr:sulfotransferase domain-containing protein [Panacibacter ginsenosidivorans]QEC68563.1 sulfotransferase domain-containing protein [Panacibacter ginsenosidivorans]
MKYLISKISIYARNILALKSTDVFLVSFPKSGNTWVRFYLCNLLNNIPSLHFTDQPIDFKILDDIMPELGKNNLTVSWPYKGFPRIIKTHIAYKPVLGKHRTILVVRDPRDVMVSYFKFEKTKSVSNFTGDNISAFIKNQKFGIEAWCKHFLSWQRYTAMIVKYEDLKERDINIFEEMNNFLSLSVDKNVFLKSVEQSRFENIKKIEESRGLADPSKVNSNFKFARSGKTGQWKEMLSAEDLNYIKDTLNRYSINLYNDYEVS